jgi:hypothetical protein
MEIKKKNVKFKIFLSDFYIYKFFNARLKFGNFSAKDLNTDHLQKF